MENKDVVFFSVNNWFAGEHYPDTPQFRKWMGDDLNLSFHNDEFCKENKLCVYYGAVDMSCNFTVSAPREWVEKNCPEIIGSKFEYKPAEGETEPDCDEIGDMPFREYREENFGAEYYDTHWWDSDDDDEEEEDDE